MNLQDMAKKVRDNAPSFVDENIVEIAFSSFVSVNSATHGDALSLRSQYKELGNDPLELIFKEECIFSDVVAMEALWAWKIIGIYYNKLDFIEKCFDQNLREVLKKRL